mgnify:CR=1 FL=1
MAHDLAEEPESGADGGLCSTCVCAAFAFAYVERLLKESPAAAQSALDKVESLLPLLDQANFAKDMCVSFFQASI